MRDQAVLERGSRDRAPQDQDAGLDRAALLERHCRRLLVAYPPDYRARRGDELVATMIEVSGPGRHRPRLADAVDLVASGLRCRIGAVTPAGLEGGLAVAAPVGLAIAAGISLFAWWRVEPLGVPTLGPIGYGAWLLAAAGCLLPRPMLSRVLVAVAIAVTLALPAVAPAVGVERPPLWVLMALSAFGLLALAGAALGADGRARTPADERLAVPAGAVAVAVCASTVMTIWPASSGVGYYYQPTIARVGVVAAAAVAALAIVAVIRLVRGGNAQPWLWAAAMLGLPAGWFGPFDSAGLRMAADQAVPQFGRLAQVLLASSVAVIAMAWLAQRRAPDAPAAGTAGSGTAESGTAGSGTAGSGNPASGVPTPGTLLSGAAAVRMAERGGLGFAGWGMLGCAAALAAFTAATGLGLIGFAGRPWQAGIPRHAMVTMVALALAGLAGILARPGHVRSRVPFAPGLFLVTGFASTAVAAWLVAAYDNDWTAGGWKDFAHTTGLVMTLAFIPFTYGVIVAARALTGRGRPARRAVRVAAAGMLAGSLGWIGYVALPYILLWGPGLVVFLACCAVVVISGRRGAPSAGTPR